MRFSVFLLLSLFALSAYKGACKAEQITNSPPCPCPAIFAPVCGADGHTYGNPCEASCAQVPVVSEGECGGSVAASPVSMEDNGCICIAVVDPVCGKNGKTYSNSCEAKCANVQVAFKGECPHDAFQELATNACPCPAIAAPVCGSDGKTYGNSCMARCNNVTVVSNGQCPLLAGCLCPAILDEVCGADGKTYANACAAKCANVEVVADGKCPVVVEMVSLEDGCVCAAILDPVCGADGKTYSNACVAKCANVTVASQGACPSGCVCTANLAPVCGIDGKTYSNACMAKCARVAVVSTGACPTQATAALYEARKLNSCTCTDEFEPCTGADGVEYSNPCKARCAGTQCSSNGN